MQKCLIRHKHLRRFKILFDEELAAKKLKLRNQNTLAAERHADKAFKAFLLESGCQSVEYCLYSEKQLDSWIMKFWFGARTMNNEQYTVNSMRSFRYGLN